MTGTLRKNKQDIPSELQPMPFTPEFSSMFAFSENFTFVSYVPKKKKGSNPFEY